MKNDSGGMNNSAIFLRSVVVRGTTIPSQFFLAAINTGFAVDGEPDHRLIEFHRARSGNGIGISFVGNVAIGEAYRVSSVTAQIDRGKKNWEATAAGILDGGSVPGIQLACQIDSEPATRKWKSENVPSYIERQRQYLCSLSSDQLQTIVRDFITASALAAEAGFQVVQIHAAHGYLLSRLLSPVLNTRRDEFGSCFHSGLSKIILGIRQNVPGVLVDVRISISSDLDSLERDWSSTRATVGAIVASGADIVSLSNGMYEVNRFQIYPTRDMGHACYLTNALEIATEYPDVMINVSGNIWDLTAFGDVPPNLTFSIGRALIADPQFVSKSVSGNFHEIQHCMRIGHCHYFSRGKSHIVCGVNDQV